MLLLVTHGGQAIFCKPLIFLLWSWCMSGHQKDKIKSRATSTICAQVSVQADTDLLAEVWQSSLASGSQKHNLCFALAKTQVWQAEIKTIFWKLSSSWWVSTCQTSLVSPEQPDLCSLDRLCLSVSMACSLSLATSVLCPYVGNVEKIQRKRGVLQTDSSFVHFHGHASTYVQAVLRTPHRH